MIKSIIYMLDHSDKIKPTETEILNLTDYLFEVEIWGYYEITFTGKLFQNDSLFCFFLLTKEMLKNYIYSSLNKTNKKLVTQLAINCLIISIDNKQFENCKYLIR